MKESEITQELWEVLNADSWLQFGIAQTGTGVVVNPNDLKAAKFSLVGGLMHCYLDKEETWSPLFEKRRSLLMASMLDHPELKHIVTKKHKYNSTSKIPLQELNSKVDYDFVKKLMVAMKQLKEG